ncbi:MAG: response regulator [candidate division KSB1 bacterium]|nr:response regulator [candidate division KSB1 bacterium]
MSVRCRVLVVDDEVPVCKSMAAALADKEREVDMALSGEEALAKDLTTPYDVVVVDLMMPGLSGMDLLKALKGRRPDVAVIMVTGYPSIRSAVQAIKLGAFDYIPKPFAPAELRSLVGRAEERIRVLRPTAELPAERPLVIVPPGLYTIPEHSWARVLDDGSVQVGMHHVFQLSVRQILSIQLPEVGSVVNQGEVLARVSSYDRNVYRLWTPVSGTVIAVNTDLTKEPQRASNDPYGQGWLVLLKPSRLEDDLRNLVRS